jgi:hypothetical protein
VINEAETTVADISLEELIAAFTAAVRRCDAAGQDVVRAQAGGDPGQIATVRERAAAALVDVDHVGAELIRLEWRVREASLSRQSEVHHQMLRSWDADVAVIAAGRTWRPGPPGAR